MDRSVDGLIPAGELRLSAHEPVRSQPMEIAARVSNGHGQHRVEVTPAGSAQPLAVAARASGTGSSVNGGEFLMLALATCYCNDLYREAARLGVQIDAVEVEAQAEFEGIGLAATGIAYRAKVSSRVAPAEIAEL